MFDLSGKVAVITGGCSGIGRGTVDVFHKAGAKVACLDVQDDKGRAIEAEYGDSVVYIHADVTDENQMDRAFGKVVERFGRLDTVFNNAGTSEAIDVDPFDMEALDRTQKLLINGVVLGMKFAVPIMASQGGGSIVNTASVAGLQAGYGGFAYSLAKGAVAHLSRVAAATLGPQNIRVNAICPGLIPTAIFGRALGKSIQEADQLVAMIAEAAPGTQPIPRAGKPEDIGYMAAFLASDESGFVTGQAIAVDGGLTTGPRSAWNPDDAMAMWERIGASEDQIKGFVGAD